MNMANGSPDVSLEVLNDSTHEPIIFIGTNTVLGASLTNNSDAIILTAGASASSLKIFLPTFFVASDVEKMSISLTNWTFSRDLGDPSLVLTYNGPSPANWNKGEKIDFKLTGVQSTAQPTTDAMQINFDNMGGNVPSQVQAPLSLSNPPRPGNAPLREVLQVTLDNQGSVYVSTETDPLRNKLFLNFKNIGAASLYTGKSHWTGTPQVTVMFVYGSTSGALAPDNKVGPPIGSAWKINGEINVDQTGGWKINPSPTTGDHPHPRWLLAPINTNEEIIGTGEHANVTFEFNHIVSLTAPGHTQVIVNCSGFMKDENTRYDDTIYIVDIVKQDPPPTRGLLNFFGEQPIITITDPKPPISIDLSWAMLNVAKINLICSVPGVNLVERYYPNPEDPLAYDSCTIKIPGMKESTAVFFTLQAFNGNGGYLNSMQFTVFINAVMFVDTRDGRVYPAVILNNQMWMAENLAHADLEFAYAYNDIPDNGKKYGLLYTAQAQSAKTLPAKWRIPSKQDWQALFDKYGNPNAAYTALLEGGASGFNAKLGGNRDNSGKYNNLLLFGYYRTSGGDLYAGFSASSKSVNLVGTLPGGALSIRYVRDL
jgi:uncharacterized protein (TIGR02145 family)